MRIPFDDEKMGDWSELHSIDDTDSRHSEKGMRRGKRINFGTRFGSALDLFGFLPSTRRISLVEVRFDGRRSESKRDRWDGYKRHAVLFDPRQNRLQV